MAPVLFTLPGTDGFFINKYLGKIDDVTNVHISSIKKLLKISINNSVC